VTETLALTPVGVGFAYGRPGEAQSCYLVGGGGTTVCLDLGSGALNRLQGHVAPEHLAAIVISHLHSDHCVDLVSLRVYMMIGPGRGRRVRVIGPPGLRELMAAFAGRDGWDASFTFEVLDPAAPCDLGGGVVMTCAPVPHSGPTFAVRLDHGGASVTYGADCRPNDALPALASGCGVLLAECSEGVGPAPEGSAHLTAADAGLMARRAGAGRLLLTHCAPEHDRDAALAAAREAFGGDVDWARQGEAVVVSAG